jgi:hypothetical protein
METSKDQGQGHQLDNYNILGDSSYDQEQPVNNLPEFRNLTYRAEALSGSRPQNNNHQFVSESVSPMKEETNAAYN